MQRQNHENENESDPDEGFVPSKIIIKEKKQFDTKNYVSNLSSKK